MNTVSPVTLKTVRSGYKDGVKRILNVILRKLARGYNWIDIAFLAGLTMVATSLSVPWVYQSYRNYRLLATAEEVAEAMELAGQFASSRGGTFQLRINGTRDSLYIADLSNPETGVAGEVQLDDDVLIRAASGLPVDFTGQGCSGNASVWLARRTGQTVQIQLDEPGKVTVKKMRLYPF